MQKALITGGSSGIGRELAEIMAREGHDLVLVARSKKQLNDVKHVLEGEFLVKVEVIEMDLSEPGSGEKLYKKTKKKDIQILVNNAGFGHMGDLVDDDLVVNQKMAQLNMITLMDLSHFFAADFVARGSGRILNTASIASFFPGPKQPVYFATKAFVRSLSRAMAHNLRGTGVTVTALHPGPTKTGFFKEAGASFFKGGASPASVAELGYKAMMSGRAEVVHGMSNKFLTGVVMKLVPARFHAATVDQFSEV